MAKFAGHELFVNKVISQVEGAMVVHGYADVSTYVTDVILTKGRGGAESFLCVPGCERLGGAVDDWDALGLVVRVVGETAFGVYRLRFSTCGYDRGTGTDVDGFFPARVAMADFSGKYGSVASGRRELCYVFVGDVAVLPLVRGEKRLGGVLICPEAKVSDQNYLDLLARKLGVSGS